MKKNESITHIMSKDVISVNRSTNFSEVKDLMDEHKINHVIVEEASKPMGVISSKDILNFSFSREFTSPSEFSNTALDQIIDANVVMSTELTTIKESENIRDAATRLASAPFNSLPVVNNDGQLVGIVTSKDLINYLLEQY